MSRKTFYFKKKLIATTTEQTEELPRLSSGQLLNFGANDVIVEFENPIDADSIILPVRGDIRIPPNMLDLRYKVNSGTTATLYIMGSKQEKS